MLAIAFKDMEILGRVSTCFQKEAVKGVIDFEEREMFEVFAYALDRQGFFTKGFITDLVAFADNSFSFSNNFP